MDEYFDRSLRSPDGRLLLVQDPPPVVFQRAYCGIHGRCYLVWLVGECGGVQLEGWLDQCDELCGWCQELLADLADGLGDGEVGQVHGDQVHRFADEVRAELGQVGALQFAAETGREPETDASLPWQLLSDSIPFRHSALAELALIASQALLRHVPTDDDELSTAKQAESLNNLGSRLAGAGHREEALAPAQEAVTLYRQLAQANPAAHNPDLAGSLANLGTQPVGGRAARGSAGPHPGSRHPLPPAGPGQPRRPHP